MEQEQEGRLGPGAGHLSGTTRSSSTEGPAETSDGPGARVAALGPWLMLFPAVFLALAVVWVLERRSAPASPPSLPPQAARSVPGWSGQLELGDGRLLAQLSPLHAAPGRQAFERRALGTRLDLGPGEPWKLVLRYAAEPGPQPEGVSLERLTVADEEGRRLAPLAPRQLAAGEPADPLRVLLTPPAEDLLPGDAIHLVLWGPEPGRAPVVRGLVRRAPLAEVLEIPLVARAVEVGPADGILARGPAPPDPPRRSRRIEVGSADLREDRPPGDVPRTGLADGVEGSVEAAVDAAVEDEEAGRAWSED